MATLPEGVVLSLAPSARKGAEMPRPESRRLEAQAVLAAKEVAAQLVGPVPVVKVFAPGEGGAEPAVQQQGTQGSRHLIAAASAN